MSRRGFIPDRFSRANHPTDGDHEVLGVRVGRGAVEVSAHTVTARRTGDWWALEVPDLPGVFTQSKRLDTAPDAAREAIGLMLGADPSTIDVAIEPLPVGVRTRRR
jgi:predicted RNase H-like HicB family nuclease